MAQQAQENQSWFAGWRQGGLPWERCNHRQHWRQSPPRGQQGHPSGARLPLQMDSLSQKCVAGRAGRVKGTAILQFYTTEMESGFSQVTSARTGKWFYVLIAESHDWRHTAVKDGISLWSQEGGQPYINFKWISDITVLRLEFLNRMGQKGSWAHMAHLLFSCTKSLVIAGVYNN